MPTAPPLYRYGGVGLLEAEELAEALVQVEDEEGEGRRWRRLR